MGLGNKVDWPLTHYDSRVNNIVTEFFIPTLSESTAYRRIAGLFSSTSFALCARGIKELIANHGRMQLIVSPILSKDDVKVLKEATNDQRNSILEKSMKIELDKIESEFEKNHVGALKYMLKEGFLEIKIEIPKDEFGQPLDADSIIKQSLLTEKRGIFQDRDGNTISFRGPVNETRESWEKGTFSITVDVDWIPGQRQHVLDDIEIFETSWNSKDTLPLPVAIRDDLVRTAPSLEDISLEKFDIPPWAVLPDGSRLWPHQIRAVNAWISNDYRGIFSIATGGGKTLSALVAESLAPQHIMTLVVVPSKVLVIQWEKEIKAFDTNADIIICDSDHDWKSLISGKLIPYLKDSTQAIPEKRLYVIATAQTACMDVFQDNFRNVEWKNLQIIGDEVHHLGAASFSKVFNINAARRLGLSATFRRDWDESGTAEILNYFGRALEEAQYRINDGINDGHLCRYSYHINFAYLSESEFDEYVQLSLKIKQAFALIKRKEDSTDLPVLSTKLEKLLLERAEILKTAEDKIRAYKEVIESNPNIPYVVFADDEEQVARLQIAHKEQISKMNKNSTIILRDDMTVFSGKSSDWQRKKILDEVKIRKTPVMAMYCLDEGIDVPEFQSAIIVSSSSSHRQYIQRRGRILRLGQKGKVAQLYDIIVLPPYEQDPLRNEIAKEAITKERERILELAEDSVNKYHVILKLEEEIRRLGFGHIT